MKHDTLQKRLDDLEALLNATSNPAFIWEAISICDDPEQVPFWVWTYLRDSATRLLALDPEPKGLPGAVLDALGLTGPGGPGPLKRAQVAARRSEAVRFMGERINAVGINEAARLTAKEYGFSTGTMRTYHFEAGRAKTKSE